MAYLSGARFIVKVPNTSKYRFLLSNRNRTIGWEDFRHGVEQRLKVAELVDCKILDKRMVLPVAKEGESVVNEFLESGGIRDTDTIIGFQAGASTPSRMWFPDRFAGLGKKLINSYPELKIIITGSPQEYENCRKIADAIGEKAIVSAGTIPLKYIPALIKRFKALVTGDTGIMHIAVAAGTPVAALFAAADPGRSGPYYDMDKHTIIKKDKTCVPCVSKKCKHQTCMENISIDEVFDVIRQAIFKST
jgi:ADP-heptose:LPS heptosyltransferase